MRLIPVLLLFAALSAAQGPLDFLNHNRSVLDAHNCYPYKGQWNDRIDRALSTGFPVAIEQDLAWYVDPATGKGRVVVSHTEKVTGDEPELRHYFFDRVRPIVEKALAENDRTKWPIIVLHFDFKTTPPPLLHAVWDLLGEYQGWFTTAPKSADPHRLTPFDPKPILAITEDSDEQEAVFYNEVPVGGRLRVFGSAHTKALPKDEREHLMATLPPDQLLTERPTTYRRWWNNSWHEVEEGGQRVAGLWTDAKDRRLRALVDYAHQMGYWIRFYTLDGFTAEEDQGWDRNYNFGSRQAVTARWKAAQAAGVNFIATDQYETLRPLLAPR
jgi:hypothetical protein